MKNYSLYEFSLARKANIFKKNLLMNVKEHGMHFAGPSQDLKRAVLLGALRYSFRPFLDSEFVSEDEIVSRIQYPDGQMTSFAYGHMQEWAFLSSEYKVWFPETSDLLDMLLRSKFEISGNISTPSHNLSLAIPRGFTFEGVELRPSLVSMWTQEQAKEHFLQLADTALEDSPPMDILMGERKASSGRSIQLHEDAARTVIAGDVLVVTTQHQDKKTGKCSMASSGLSVETCKVLLENGIAPSVREWRTDGASPAALESYCSLYLFFALSYYVELFPEMLRPGMPSGEKKNYDLKKRGIVVGLPKKIKRLYKEAKTSGGRKGYLKSGHFREYKSDRFTKMKGKRAYIWPHMVAPTVANKVETSTVEKTPVTVTTLKPQIREKSH